MLVLVTQQSLQIYADNRNSAVKFLIKKTTFQSSPLNKCPLRIYFDINMTRIDIFYPMFCHSVYNLRRKLQFDKTCIRLRCIIYKTTVVAPNNAFRCMYTTCSPIFENLWTGHFLYDILCTSNVLFLLDCLVIGI